MTDPDDPDHLPDCGERCAAGCPIARVEREMDATAEKLRPRAQRREPTPDLQASRAAARLRVRAAMQHVEAAQRELSLACADLGSVNGFSQLQTVVGKLAERVRAAWYRLEERWKSSIDAPFVGSWPMATLDDIAAPDGRVRDDEDPHRGCGHQVGGVAFHGLLRSTQKVGAIALMALALSSLAPGCGDNLEPPAPTVDAMPLEPDAPLPDACLCVAVDGAVDGVCLDKILDLPVGVCVTLRCEFDGAIVYAHACAGGAR